MRARLVELRLLGAGLTLLWLIEAILILVGYRPGGPADLLVGLAALLPVAVAAIALLFPPVARGSRAFAAVAWVGAISGLLLVPSIIGLVTQLTGRGTQTLLPSLEVAYAWGLALFATGIFSGLGLARRLLGAGALRRRRLVAGVGLGAAFTLVSGGIFGSAAVANDIALSGKPAIASRFGPTDPSLQLPTCEQAITRAPAATVTIELSGDVDLRSVGGATLQGVRDGADLHWIADAATSKLHDRFGATRIGSSGWLLAPGSGWTTVEPASLEPDLLDTRVVETALRAANLVASQTIGIDLVEGARARHCIASVSGADFLDAFPQTAWITGSDDLHGWSGSLEYWVFADGQLGQVVGHVQGEARQIGYPKPGASGSTTPTGILATIYVRLTATDRDRHPAISAP